MFTNEKVNEIQKLLLAKNIVKYDIVHECAKGLFFNLLNGNIIQDPSGAGTNHYSAKTITDPNGNDIEYITRLGKYFQVKDQAGVTLGNYEYVYTKHPVKAINGVLYATSETIEKSFNVSFNYDQEKNEIRIYTLPYLIETYSNRALDYGYNELSDVFSNQKAILDEYEKAE